MRSSICWRRAAPASVKAPSPSTSPRAPQARRPTRPTPRRPSWREAWSAARGTSPEAAWHDERVDAVEPGVDQAGDVPVAAELAQQGDGVPEREVRRRPATAGRRGRRRAGARRRCTPSAAVRASSAARATAGVVEEVAGGAPQGGVDAASSARVEELRPAWSTSHARGDGVVHDGRVEVEERGHHDLGRHRSHRRGAGGEVAVEAHHPERLVGGRRLGREVDRARGTARASATSSAPSPVPCRGP